MGFKCPCAVKKITKESLENKQIETALLWQEIETLDKFDHPNIVRVLDFCEDEDNIYIVFELIETGDLAKNIGIIKDKLLTQSKLAIERAIANIMH